MAIRKRGNSWQLDYFDPNGKRVRLSFKKKKEAEDELAARRVLSRGNPQRYFEKAKVYTAIFDELAKVYREFAKDQRSWERSKKYMVVDLEKEFSGRILADISYKDLEQYRTKLKRTLTKHGVARTVATVNRTMACLRHMMKKAVDWEMIERNPFEKGDSLQVKENNKRLRYLSLQEIDDLLGACPVPQKGVGIRDFVLIAINTGMRKGEILSLKWEQIHNSFIYLDKTKTDEARQIPIREDLRNCLDGIRQRQRITIGYIFSDGKRGHIKDIKTSFKSVLAEAKIKDFRPHDLRHTFASHYMMRGGSLNALQKILGHADIKMTMRYAHLSKEFAKEEIQIMNGLTDQLHNDPQPATVTKVSHFVDQPEKKHSENPLSACNHLVELRGVEPLTS